MIYVQSIADWEQGLVLNAWARKHDAIIGKFILFIKSAHYLVMSEWMVETGRPRAVCGQRYPLPCFARL